jgi:hypothetical protein
MPRGKSIGGLSISELQRMIGERRSMLQKLQKQRAEALRRLNSIEREIAKLDGGAGGGRGRGGMGGGRARNAVSLVSAIEGALKKGDPMSVGEIVDAVQAGGYRSSSANFRGIVNQTLIKERKRFASPSRGMYQLKK